MTITQQSDGDSGGDPGPTTHLTAGEQAGSAASVFRRSRSHVKNGPTPTDPPGRSRPPGPVCLYSRVGLSYTRG